LAPPPAAVVAQVPVPSVAEAALPQVPVLADLAVQLWLAVLELPQVVVDPVVLAQRAAPALVEAAPVVLAAEEELVDLLSRQSFSAATARTTP
jgi:hypothetical protein